jgi:hypothetical protein
LIQVAAQVSIHPEAIKKLLLGLRSFLLFLIVAGVAKGKKKLVFIFPGALPAFVINVMHG